MQACGEFDREETSLDEILSAMNAVNAFRIDAHAKDISDIDYAKLIRSIELLEGIFLPP
jgi:hypothetical protein